MVLDIMVDEILNGTWTEVKNTNDILMSGKIINSSANHYNNYVSSETLHRYSNDLCKIYKYTSDETKISLFFSYKSSKKMWKIKHGAYSGGDPIKAMDITWDKIKYFLKEQNVNEAFAEIANIIKYNEDQRPYLERLLEKSEVIETKSINKSLLEIKIK